MSDPLATTHLGLPYLSAAQAQKHVTHNEALRSLDALVQIAVLDAAETDPPPTPAEGDRYIVATSATGAWSGHDGELAAYVDGAWAFFTPVEGWIVFDLASQAVLVFDSSAWTPVSAFLGPIDQLGVNTTADATNRLAVHSNAVLFTGIEAGEGGTGDVRFVVNKEADADTASLLFQSGFSGRAEIGLAGDTDFVFKVSANGADWVEAIRIDKDSGLASILYDNTASGLAANTVQDAIDEVAAAGGAVTSVFGRTGAVAAAASDYDADQVDFTPAGGIAATDVQTAIEELDSEKQASLGFTPRETLAADRTYYVDATNGSDPNDGLAAGSGNAFATLQHALDVCATIDFGGYTVTIQLADGSYARADVPVMVGQGSADDLVIQGNTGDATAVVVDSSSSFVGAISCLAGAMCTVQYIKTTSSVSNGYDLYTEGAMTFNNVQFAGTQHHIVARYNAAIMRGNNYEIVGSAIQHIRCLDKGQFRIAGGTITLTGTPAFSSAFVFAHQLSEISFSGNSFSGSATGTRFSIQGNSFLQVGGDPDTILPGDAAGSTSTGGQYG